MFWVLLLLPAWAVAGVACTRLCLAAARAAAVDREGAAAGREHDLTLYEVAFLSGGPARVAELTLVSMARQRRLLLAHTGWATVVDPRGRDDMERSVIGAIGPGGQSRIAPVRAAAAAADAVRHLADRLVVAGLAVPYGSRTTVAAGMRRVRLATAAVVALATAALLLPGSSDLPRSLVALWFALPLALTLSCLAIARVEAHPYSHWASPAGQRLVGSLVQRVGGGAGGDDRAYLARVAVRGVRAIGEPELRAALAHRDDHRERRD
ncbi:MULTISPECIES: TIGR04222 domain-containing membrane protein [unclassified Streptomyces]|uniref:TIGR04222 domain-containing membrane protein n=1 Tax=unclassified Streptomyces TaxID=2593676 RepID=UPI001F044270|nr:MULTISPECIES: TIGR04222 domain-containing membrane protein [unclassified Streptomyces]MCH0561671.1 TIGR04222 domain-containing membrane protein [Streptomyces sp. MUM 2J]MCH0568956.1 TIGR04222 domain-containing membrane protein [Streptomyces sp. MUM 136J]